MRTVERIPRLSEAEAQDLATRSREGDPHAGEELVARHLYVVLQLATQMRVRPDNALDLLQEGSLGLLEALRRFDVDRGVPFSAYARYWARARMLAYISTYRRLVQPGRPTRQLLSKILRMEQHLAGTGDPTDDTAIAAALGVGEADVRRARSTVPLHDDSFDSGEHLDRVAHAEDDPETAVARQEISRRVADAVTAFAGTLDNPRDQILFFERIASDEPVSLAELGRRFGVSRERVRQLESRLLPRFRTHLKEWGVQGPET